MKRQLVKKAKQELDKEALNKLSCPRKRHFSEIDLMFHLITFMAHQ